MEGSFKATHENRTDVEEYLDNNKGAKSYLDLGLSEGRPVSPNGPNLPQTAAPTQSATNKMPADTNADVINPPLTKDNTIILQNEDVSVQKSSDVLKNEVNNKIEELKKNVRNIDSKDYASQKYTLTKISEKLDNNKPVFANELKGAGINTKNLGFFG